MKYSNEEKLSIISRYQQGESIATLSDELNIPRSTLYRWLNSFPTDSAGKPLKFSYQEYALLQRKVEKLQNVIMILKAVDCLASAPLKDRLYALEPFYGKYEVHTICEALDVDRGTFYNHMLRSKRGNAWFDKRRQEYCQLIRDVFDEYRQVLGAEKIRTILVQRGHQVSAEYVSRLMHEMGLSSVRTTAKQEYLKLREPERKKNILRQQFNAQQPNQRWVSDVTCFKLGEHYFYTTMKPMPILGDLHRHLKSNELTQRLATIISRFVTGSAQSFNRATNVDLTNKYIVLDISELKGKMLPVGMMIALDYVWDTVKSDRTKRKMIFLDELWRLVGGTANRLVAEFCLEVFLIGRGYGAGACGALQNLSALFDFEGGQYGRAILNNCKTKIILNLEPEEAEYVKDVLKLSRSEIRSITQFERGEALLASNSNKVPVIIKISDTEKRMITTDRAELEAIVNELKESAAPSQENA